MPWGSSACLTAPRREPFFRVVRVFRVFRGPIQTGRGSWGRSVATLGRAAYSELTIRRPWIPWRIMRNDSFPIAVTECHIPGDTGVRREPGCTRCEREQMELAGRHPVVCPG